MEYPFIHPYALYFHCCHLTLLCVIGQLALRVFAIVKDIKHSVKSLTAPERSAGARLWFCESKGSVVQGSRVQRRAQSSNWTEDERELGLSRNR